jgi:HD-like signal output (HDOD) protein
MTIDRSKVVHAARNGIPLVIRTHTLPPQTEVDLEEILGIFLEELGQTGIRDHLSYCLRELTGNAKKANTKRVYFQEKGLRLSDPAEYARGMETFKADTLGNIGHYLALQEAQDLHIKVSFLIRHQVLHLGVRNNCPMTPVELGRLTDRIVRSRVFDSMEQAFEEVLDDSEGAGLGIVILVLMLRKMGLTEKAFTLDPGNQETCATLSIPMDGVKVARINTLSDQIAQAVDGLPPFPENLKTLLGLLEDPEVAFGALAAELARDPAMAADLLRYLHSAAIHGSQRVDSLEEAIRIVGTQGLRTLLYPYGAHRVLERYLEKQRPLWENATRVSFYASELARECRLPKHARGDAQIAGLLYNLGQIVVTSVHPELSARVEDFCRERGYSVDVFDQLAQSINPAELAARIARHWEFPDSLVDVLANQNYPQGAPPAVQPVVCAVHLAASLRAVELDLVAYGQVRPEVLKGLGLRDAGTVETLHRRMAEAFQAGI